MNSIGECHQPKVFNVGADALIGPKRSIPEWFAFMEMA